MPLTYRAQPLFILCAAVLCTCRASEVTAIASTSVTADQAGQWDVPASNEPISKQTQHAKVSTVQSFFSSLLNL